MKHHIIAEEIEYSNCKIFKLFRLSISPYLILNHSFLVCFAICLIGIIEKERLRGKERK